MEWKIVIDSCCDATPELCEKYGMMSVPLTINMGDRHISDDECLDMPRFIEDMKNCKEKIGSSAPSPMLFRDAFIKAGKSFAVTLSSKLSATYNNALIGMEMAREEGAEVHVFDSKSGSAGEVLLALKISDMIRSGFKKPAIIASIESFIRQMKTYFVLDSLDNLIKNGRIGKITGKIISALNIRPVMGADDGSIELFSHARGEAQVIEKLADTIKQSGRDVEGERIVISHCNNQNLAAKLMQAIAQKYRFKEILTVPTRGISSIYANNKGLVISF
ncbi:MAG: DegV family protein [Clostridiales bacterium]|jgi:DegV family protein with EDD domain|nr:DegV family protein [Clostridiales bacterium]